MDLNLDFYENIVIFKALTDTQYLSAIIDYIRPEYFKKTEIRDIFEVIAKCFERTSKVPTITEIKTYLKDEAAINSFKRLVESFRDIDKNLDQDELYKNTERFIKERAVYETVLNVAKDISNGKVDTSEILLNFEKSCNVNLVTDSGFDLYRDIDDLIHDLNNTQATIPTGWKWLDENIGGGLLENGRAIYVIAGETNIGKSIVLGNIAANLVDRDKNVLLISLEMPELLYAKRICSNVTKIPQKELGQNTQTLRHLIKEQGQAGKGKLLIKEFPPSTITCNQLKVFIKRIIDSGIKIDAIVLDYINLMHTTIGTNSYERIKHITEQLRALTYVFNCPLVSATQLGRCLHVDSQVITSGGISKKIKDLCVGEKIRGKDKDVEVRYIYPTSKQQVFKLTLKSGKQIICSRNHIFPTSCGNMKSINSGLQVGESLLSATQTV